LAIRSPGPLVELSGDPSRPTATRTANANQATVIKLEFNPDGRFLGDAFESSFNNSIWLRYGIRESIRGPVDDPSGAAPRLKLRSATDVFGNPVDVGQDFVGDRLESSR